MQITDGTEFAIAALENVKMQCIIEIQFNVSYWIVDQDGDTKLPDNLFDSICPQECNNKGTCVKGMQHFKIWISPHQIMHIRKSVNISLK